MKCFPDDSESVDKRTDKIRVCTDTGCLVVYFLFWVVMILAAAIAFVYGNPNRLLNGYDSFGYTCGINESQNVGDLHFPGLDVSSKRYLFYMDYVNPYQSLRICVEKCPDKYLESISDLEKFYERTGSLLCRYDMNFTTLHQGHYFPLYSSEFPLNSEDMSSRYGPCPVLPIYKSTPVLNRCIPSVPGSVYSILNGWNFPEEFLSNVYLSWNWVLSASLFSFTLSWLMVMFIHFFPKAVSWLLITGSAVSSLVLASVLWWAYISIKCDLDKTPEDLLLDESVKNEEAFLWSAIIASLTFILLVFLAFTVRKTGPCLPALYRESSNCLAKLPSLHLLPVLTFLFLIGFYTFWINVVIRLVTASYPESKNLKPYSGFKNMIRSTDDNGPNGLSSMNISIAEVKSFTEVEYADPLWIWYLCSIYIIGLFWVPEFLFACQHFIVSGSVAKWYFNREEERFCSIILTTTGNLLLYHLGSVAKGSALITIFKIPRLISFYIYKKCRKFENSSSSAKCHYCFYCFYSWDKFLKYMTHDAYPVVAIQDIGFCTSAYRAWITLADNPLKLSTTNEAADTVLFLGKCFVASTVGSVAVLCIKYHTDLLFYAAPTLLAIILAYCVAHTVLSLYEVIIDTSVLCVCEDKEINGNDGYWRRSLLCTNSFVNRTPFPIEPTHIVEL